MKRIVAIASLTLKAAFRYRLVMVLAVLLIGAVGVLPLIIKDDGTARGFSQILLTYTLSAITFLLGFTTLWLSCSTLAREVEDCQIQMVVVKPIGRWQIWLGKWLGILALNAMLLTLAGGSVYGLLLYRARHLSPDQRQILENEVLVSRSAAKEKMPDIEPFVEEQLKRRLREQPVATTEVEAVRRQVREQIKAELQVIRPNYVRRWVVNLGLAQYRLRGQPLVLRVKFAATENQSTLTIPRSYNTIWLVGVPDSGRIYRCERNLAADSFIEFSVPPDLFDSQGDLTIECVNPPTNTTSLLFQLEDGLEVLYREGGFGLNFIRGLSILFCWLALLAALGLAAASFLSFPVAVFVSLAVMVVAFSSGTMAQIVEERGITGIDPNTGQVAAPALLDQAAVAAFSTLLHVVKLARDFSPIDALSTGRTIAWSVLARAIGQIVFLLGGIFAALGIALFQQRELATAQGSPL